MRTVQLKGLALEELAVEPRARPATAWRSEFAELILRNSRSADGRPDLGHQRQNELWWNVS